MGLPLFNFRRATPDSTVGFSCQIRPRAYSGKASRRIREALLLYLGLIQCQFSTGSRAWSQ